MAVDPDKRETKTAADGTDYEVLKTGTSVEYKYVDYTRQEDVKKVGGYPVHNIYVECKEVKEKLLPTEANPREPTNSPVVGAMHDTLESSPDRFVRRNNGITLICKDIDELPESNKIELTFSDDDEGICNGGHTYFSIQTFGGSFNEAGVHIEAIEVPEEVPHGDREDEIADIAQARNNINNLDDHTILDYLGCFDPLKEYMHEPRVVAWHEGDSEAIKPKIPAKALIRYMAVMDPLKYEHQIINPNGNSHRNSALGYGDFSDWRDDALTWRSGSKSYPQKHMAPIIDDILEIKDMVASSLKRDNDIGTFRRSGLYQEHLKDTEQDLHFGRYEGEIGHDINATVEVMMVGMFRSNVYIHLDTSANPVCAGWLVDPQKLWDDKKEPILDTLSEYYSSEGNLREFMNSPAPYKEQLYQFDSFASDYPYPAHILYDVESGGRYGRVDDESDATHWLGPEGLVAVEDKTADDDIAPYEKE